MLLWKMVESLEIPGHQLPDQEAILVQRNQRVDDVAVFPSAGALPHQQQHQRDEQAQRPRQRPVVQPDPDVICTFRGKADRPGRELAVKPQGEVVRLRC